MNSIKSLSLSKYRIIIFFTSFIFLSIVPLIQGHVPISGGDNENLEEAIIITNPTKSWAIYSILEEAGVPQYFGFEIDKGDQIYFSLLKSTRSEDKDFLPSAILMGEHIVSNDIVPEYIDKPNEYNAILIQGSQTETATYESFGPGSYYGLGELSLSAPESGIYYIAVFEPSTGGHYSLAIGRTETFSLDEWILNPINMIDVYQWGGQNIIMIFAPLIFTVAIGSIIIFLRMKESSVSLNYLRYIGLIGGLIFIGTGVSLIYQMIYSILQSSIGVEIVLTIMFALAPLLIGLLVTRTFLRTIDLKGKTRMYLIIYGLIGLFTWSGIIIAPIITIILALIPMKS